MTEKMPKMIVVLGPHRYRHEVAVAEWLLERDEGYMVLGLPPLPKWYPQVPDDFDVIKPGLQLQKVEVADAVFVLNRKEYMDDLMKKGVEHAKERGISVRYYTQDKIGQQIETMIEDFIHEG